MATKQENIDNPESCWNKAGPNEPVFVLRGTDVLAMGIVHQWANGYLMSKARQPEGPTLKQMEKYREAYDAANAMWDWYTKNVVAK